MKAKRFESAKREISKLKLDLEKSEEGKKKLLQATKKLIMKAKESEAIILELTNKNNDADNQNKTLKKTL